MNYYRTKNFQLITLDVFKETPSSIYFEQPHRHIGCMLKFCWHNQNPKRNTKDSFMTADKYEAINWLEQRRDMRIQNYNRAIQEIWNLDVSNENIHKIQLSRQETIKIESFEVDLEASKALTIKTKSKRTLNTFNKSRTVAVYLSAKKYQGKNASYGDQLVFGTWLIRDTDSQRDCINWLDNRRRWLEFLSWS